MGTVNVDKAVSYAKTQVDRVGSFQMVNGGTHSSAGWCLLFVEQCYIAGGYNPGSLGSAKKCSGYIKNGTSTDYNPPLGAAVWMDGSSTNSHIGISAGGGYVIHSVSSIKNQKITNGKVGSMRYKGWGWLGGTPSRISTFSDGTDDEGTGTAEATEPPHIPQTERVYTLYEDDDPYKGVDRYAVIIESRLYGTTTDITNRCGNILIKDDADSFCQELSFDVIHSNGERYLPNLNVVNGDIVAIKNTATDETVFLGQIQTKNLSGTTVSYTAIDMGFILTKNDVIMQFDNIAFKEALPQIAKRLGIQKTACPDLISSIYGVKKERASDIIKNALDTVSEEVGLRYFARMKGSNVLTIQSFAEKPIDLYCRKTDVTPVFRVLDETTDPAVSWSIEDLANEVIVYSDSDNEIVIKSDKEDSESIKRYFRRVRAETISDNETVSADTKANNLLAELSSETRSVTLSCYNSDRAVAGARITLNHYACSGDYWITSVDHNISEGTMTLSLEGVN